MKIKYPLVFALFITITALLSGCAKSNSELAAENADLKARIQKLEQQLQASGGHAASPASPGAESASTQDLRSQLAEAQKQAEAAADQLKSLTSEVENQKAQIVSLTRQLSAAEQARDEAEKALKLYRDNATSAIKQFQALRSTLGGKTVIAAGYRQNYLATQTAVTRLADALPESAVRRHIMAVLAMFTQVNDICETADQQMQARTRQAKANYDKFLEFGGLGPNDYVIQIGKDKILAPAEQENAATASKRDQQVVALEKDLDLGIKDLQALVNG